MKVPFVFLARERHSDTLSSLTRGRGAASNIFKAPDHDGGSRRQTPFPEWLPLSIGVATYQVSSGER